MTTVSGLMPKLPPALQYEGGDYSPRAQNRRIGTRIYRLHRDLCSSWAVVVVDGSVAAELAKGGWYRYVHHREYVRNRRPLVRSPAPSFAEVRHTRQC